MGDRTPRSLDALVNYQVQRWAAASSATTRGESVPEHRPVITVSREYGTQGSALARLVAERLGFRVWDQELVHAVAEDAGASERVIATLDERRRNAIGDVLSALTQSRGRRVSSSEYVERLLHVIHTVGAHGAAVIVGRGGNFALASTPHLAVRAVASVEARVASLVARFGGTEAAALAKAREVEQDREGFVQQTYDRDVALSSAYDVTVNTGTMTLDQAAAIVVAAYQARFGAAPAPARVG